MELATYEQTTNSSDRNSSSSSSNMFNTHVSSQYKSNNYNNHYTIDYYELYNDTTTMLTAAAAATTTATNTYANNINFNSNSTIITDNNDNSNNGNANNNNCSNDNLIYDNYGGITDIYLIILLIHNYYEPIVICTGSIGNILSIVVFFKTKLRKLSSSYYLAALAISDTCFLLTLFVNWLNVNDIINAFNYDISCKLNTFLSCLACFCSDWFVVAFTVERFIAVLYPLKRQTMCTVRRAKIVLFGLTIVGCMHCTPFWFGSAIKREKDSSICSIDKELKYVMQIFNYWDSFIGFAVPFMLIVTLNTWTACTVWKFATVRRSLTMQKRKDTLTKNSITSNANNVTSSSTYRSTKKQSSTCPHPSGQNCITQQQQHHHQHHHHHAFEQRKQSAKRKLSNSSQLKVTKMLMVVSTVFVCLNLPSCVMRIKLYLEPDECSNSNLTTVVLQYIFNILFITNFGINFVLYCVSGQNFRKAVLSMFRPVSQAQREGTTQVTVSEYCRNSGGGNGASSRRRLMSHNCWNELHELKNIK